MTSSLWPHLLIHTDLVCQDLLNKFTPRVQKIHQLVGVHFLGGSKHNHLKLLAHALKELSEVWPCAHKHLKVFV